MVILQNKLCLSWTCCPTVFGFGTFVFLIFINDLPKFINDKSVPILFADDTSILVSHPDPMVFYNTINIVFPTLHDWFKQNLLSLNFSKTHFIKFTTKNNNQIEIKINYDNKLIPAITYWMVWYSLHNRKSLVLE